MSDSAELNTTVHDDLPVVFQEGKGVDDVSNETNVDFDVSVGNQSPALELPASVLPAVDQHVQPTSPPVVEVQEPVASPEHPLGAPF